MSFSTTPSLNPRHPLGTLPLHTSIRLDENHPQQPQLRAVKPHSSWRTESVGRGTARNTLHVTGSPPLPFLSVRLLPICNLAAQQLRQSHPQPGISQFGSESLRLASDQQHFSGEFGVEFFGELVLQLAVRFWACTASVDMGFLDRFTQSRAMRYQKGDKVHPATFDESLRASSLALSTPSKEPRGKRKREPPMGWDKAGGYPNLPLPPPATCGRPRRKSSSSCSLCYCLSFFFSFLVILIILAGLTVFIFYVAFQPKFPKATIQNVAMTSFNVTNRHGGPIASLADLQNPVLNANIAFTIQVENPNDKLGIHFKDVSVYVSYQGTPFAHSFVPPFYQGRKTKSEVVADLKATSAPLSESQGKELQAAINQNDIPLSARITVGAALEIGSWVIPPGHIQVVCNLRASPPSAPQGAKLLSKSCKWVRNPTL